MPKQVIQTRLQFHEHVMGMISGHCQLNARIMLNAKVFCLVTQRMPLPRAVQFMIWFKQQSVTDILTWNRADVVSLTGDWANGPIMGDRWLWIQEYARDYMVDWQFAQFYSPREFFTLAMTAKGLNYTKAAFYVQLVYGKDGYGCLDTHNLKMMGLDSKFSSIDHYIDVQSSKTSVQWWRDWCDYVATQWAVYQNDGYKCSNDHLRAII